MRRLVIVWFGCALICLLGCNKETPPATPAPAPASATTPTSAPDTNSAPVAAPADAIVPSGWLTSVPEAEAVAKKDNKLVLLNFTGSDWCAACKVLDNTVFSNKTFVEFAQKNLVLVYLDYPFAAKQPEALEQANNQLKSNFNITGYPVLIAIKPDGQPVWTNLGLPDGGVTNVIAQLEEARKK